MSLGVQYWENIPSPTKPALFNSKIAQNSAYFSPRQYNFSPPHGKIVPLPHHVRSPFEPSLEMGCLPKFVIQDLSRSGSLGMDNLFFPRIGTQARY